MARKNKRRHTMSSSSSSPHAHAPAPAPLIWFMLLDSATGEPFKGTTVSSVLRSSLVISVIDQFRDAVHLKNSSILTGITSSQLLVFMNKAAFDKRNADDGKEEPLEEDSPVDGLGTSKKEAVIVAVPSTSGDSLLPFISCSLSFYLGSQSSSPLSLSLSLSVSLSLSSLYLLFSSLLFLFSSLLFSFVSLFSSSLLFSSLYLLFSFLLFLFSSLLFCLFSSLFSSISFPFFKVNQFEY
jgi:hypothetical protein